MGFYFVGEGSSAAVLFWNTGRVEDRPSVLFYLIIGIYCVCVCVRPQRGGSVCANDRLSTSLFLLAHSSRCAVYIYIFLFDYHYPPRWTILGAFFSSRLLMSPLVQSKRHRIEIGLKRIVIVNSKRTVCVCRDTHTRARWTPI